MQQFIPFEDDWDALEKLCLGALVPYRVGLVPVHEPGSSQTGRSPDPNGRPGYPLSAPMPTEKTA
jgi:hypothetical protein